MVSNGQQIGTIAIPNVSFMPGSSRATSNALYNPTTTAAQQVGNGVLTNFINGKDSAISIRGRFFPQPFHAKLQQTNINHFPVGSTTSTQITSLQGVYASLDIAATLPGSQSKLLSSGQMSVNAGSSTAQVYVYGNNPFGVQISITHITATFSSVAVSI